MNQVSESLPRTKILSLPLWTRGVSSFNLSVGATEALTKAQRFIENRATSSEFASRAGMAIAAPLAPTPKRRHDDDKGPPISLAQALVAAVVTEDVTLLA